MDEALQEHICRGSPGTCCEFAPPNFIREGVCGRQSWRAEQHAEGDLCGPIGLLLASCARVGIRVDGEWMCYADFMPPFSIVREPWQSLQMNMVKLSQRAALAEVAESRGSLGVSPVVDWPMTTKWGKDREAPDKGLLRALIAGGIWTSHEAYKAGMQETPQCCHCGAEEGGLEHLLWRCSNFEAHRERE